MDQKRQPIESDRAARPESVPPFPRLFFVLPSDTRLRHSLIHAVVGVISRACRVLDGQTDFQ